MKKFFPLFFPAAVLVIAFLQYANAIGNEYAWDDKLVITDNAYTRQGIGGLATIFTRRVSVPGKNVYRPVPQALFAAEYDLFHGDPHALHFFNALWYAVLCLVLYRFIRFVFPAYHPVFACAASLLFAVHPLHAEAVANIKSRDEILAMLFGLAALMLLVKAVEEKKWWLLFTGVCCFVLAYASKANAVTLLPVALLVYWFRHSRFRLGRRQWIVAATAAVTGGTALWLSSALPRSEIQQGLESNATVLNNIFLWTTHPQAVVPTALVNTGRYLLLFVYPHPLVHQYGYNQLPLSYWSSPETWLVCVLLLFGAWYVLRNLKRKTPIVFGTLFFVITYSIYSNLFVLAPDTMADRYMFIPSAGWALVVTALFFRAGAVSFQAFRIRGWRATGAVLVFGIMAAGFCIRTVMANRDWKNDYTLIYNRIQYMENNAAAQATYGYMLYRESEGMPAGEPRREKQVQAMQAFMRSIAIYPDFHWSWVSVGKIFAAQKVYDKAELCFLKAQQTDPLSPDGYFCLGSLYYTVGDPNMAASYLEKTVVMEPDMENAYLMLGKSYLQLNSFDNLGALSETACKWFPRNAEFAAFRATYFYHAGQYREAARYIGMALQLDPKNITARMLRTLPAVQPAATHHQGDSTKTLVTPAP